jgi:hypothetical protein
MAMKRKNQQMETESGLTVTQLATRVPKDLYKTVKVFCVTHDTSVADFVTDALEHELELRRAETRERRVEKPKPTKAAKKKARPVADDDYEPTFDDEDAA